MTKTFKKFADVLTDAAGFVALMSLVLLWTVVLPGGGGL